jgi:nucleotide-binding universal stress UspA family protein
MSGRIERVVVPLDATSETRSAIAIAARLAANAKARLHGVFIEDEELLQLARLPFARHVTAGAGAEPLSAGKVEQQLRAAAERARQELAAAAGRNGIDWSFEVVRRAAGSPFVAAGERDLVVAGALSRPIGGHFRVEWRWWSAIESVPGPLLLARHGWDPSGAVLVLLRDRGPGSARLLDMASQLAAAAGGALTVICPPELANEDGFAAWLAERIAPYSARLQIELTPSEPADLERRLVELGCRVLAVHSGPGERSDRLRTLFGRLACDILVVR